MGLKDAFVRTFGVAALTLAVAGGAHLLYFVAFCPRADLAARMKRGAPVVVDSGYRYARPGEAIYTCRTKHVVGPFALHDDFDCYCAPAGTDLAELGRVQGGVCTVDKPAPARTDEYGICRHAHCAEDR